MAVLIAIRHGRSTANSRHILAGRGAGVELDTAGASQADALVDRLAACPIGRIVSSPLLRCRQTVAPVAAARGIAVESDERLTEVDYGSWTNRPLSELADEPLWRTVQEHPSAAAFPDGERLADAAHRAATAARELAGEVDAGGAVVVCSHGDIIKAILADALGLHLDMFQRIVVSPASINVIRYMAHRAFVEKLNINGDLTVTNPHADAPPGAVIGGDTGGDTASATPTISNGAAS